MKKYIKYIFAKSSIIKIYFSYIFFMKVRYESRVRRKKIPGKMVPWEKRSPEKWSPEKWSLEKCPPKIVLRQKNVRKFEQLFYFYRLNPVHTQKVFDVHLTTVHTPNCRTLKESKKVCCQVLGFHRSITSQHFTHTHDARRSLHDFSGDHSSWENFSGDQYFAKALFGDLFIRGPCFQGTIFPGIFFPGLI